MLTVWTLLWGDKYRPSDVYWMRDSVAGNLRVPHRFVCVTEQDLPDLETVAPPVDWPGWWGKLAVPGMGTEQNIWLDLDVVITGSLDFLLPFTTGPLAMAWNWAQSGHGGCQSSVMAWGGKIDVQAGFDPAWAHWPPRNERGIFWGDQEYITHLRDTGQLEVVEIQAQFIKSYKYHCRHGLPKDCRVVVFHGDPKPKAVSEDWLPW